MTSERPTYRPTLAPSAEPEGSQSEHNDRDFLFHLHRGSELLQENSVEGAKAELEVALGMQPQDAKGQGLLGVVYFRLGLLSRAIQIYERLERTSPEEVTPKINLALCYLKTGRFEAARERLLAVVERAPHHTRAWKYLGLAYERAGELARAKDAFERGGHVALAQRVAALSDQPAEARPPGALFPSIPAPSVHLSPLPPSVVHGSNGRSVLPRLPTTTSVAPLLEALLRERGIEFPSGSQVVLHHTGVALARFDTSFTVRGDGVAVLYAEHAGLVSVGAKGESPGTTAQLPGQRVAPGQSLVSLVGSGRVILTPTRGMTLFLVELNGEPVYLRESRLVGFASGVRRESGWPGLGPTASDVVARLSGAGTVVGTAYGQPHSLRVLPSSTLSARRDWVVGWLGQELSLPVPVSTGIGTLIASDDSIIAFSGQGTVLIETAQPRGD